MSGMLWLEGAVRREPAIDAWLNEQPPELGAIARTWFLRMRDCGGDVRELMHDGCPVACVGDAAATTSGALGLAGILLVRAWHDRARSSCWITAAIARVRTAKP